jgi:ABC-type phosphate transport system substrate-binding protein
MMSYNKCTGLRVIGLALSFAINAAMADVVAVVSSKSPITTLTKSQIADIFFGKTGHLSNGVQPVPIDQAEGSVARNEFYLKVADKSAAQMKAYWSRIIFTGRGQPPQEVRDSAEMKKRISENLAAIGYIDLEMVDGTVRTVQTQ